MGVKENLQKLKEEIPSNVTIVAVSKTKSIDEIMQAYDAEHRDFGENYVQELRAKQPLLPPDIRWHYIGTLQTKQIKYITPFIHLIHSVTSIKHLEEINKRAKQNDRIIPVLIELHIADETTKSGVDEDELWEILDFYSKNQLPNVEIQGLMGMATLTDDQDKIRNEFKKLKILFDKSKEKYFYDKSNFKHISMGMSGDYKLAIEQGSTIIRIGTLIFGEREYKK
ncbi:MAG: YggS family pyridoxal phosphate-dependent enzyme [Bacteroidales bacterium]|jgi:pyridoxal phosphate enzyme (YggS family)|nr:YggS family pyridoxal phosphate-dependent enzyme [Bacteroidales bacterium]MDI9575231.1 YggS family pyridoxal phosphate-dependent enzyme [Bacteroidota bacterium]MDD3756359.1 YggS family pyridoxal phosphate-dependent enzyme [Bacteroidales bacterium]MDY0401287.1 YggS family pyridoxal phosphate-dependent enzyme [Bacteroidales bacterium]HHW59668.1 YggS family pyridoxal phosphate-dependent enzyme [Bacteroidales bacterium]